MKLYNKSTELQLKYAKDLILFVLFVLFIMDINKIFKYYFFIIMYLFVIVAVIKIILLILSPPTLDFKDSIDIGERGALFLAVITGLVFTYADALDPSKKKDIIKSGESFFKSFLIFVIGMIFSIGLRSALIHPTNPLGLPDLVLAIGSIAMLLLLFISLATIIISGWFFAIGITGLITSFRRE